MTPFAEADARLSAMHGYEPATAFEAAVAAYRVAAMRHGLDNATMDVVVACWRVLFEQQARLEAKLDTLMLALKAGAVGRWQ